MRDSVFAPAAAKAYGKSDQKRYARQNENDSDLLHGSLPPRIYIYDQCMRFGHGYCMVLFGKSKENIDTSGHEKFAPFLPLFSDFTNRKTPENLINRTSGVFSSMRITGLEPARHRHQILSLARLPIPPYPHDLKIESKITTCRITCSANDPLLDVSYIRSYIIMDEKISGNQFQDIVTK